MLKPRYFLVLVALATVGAVGYVLRADHARTPAALLSSAKEHLLEEQPDYDAALRELDRALELGGAAGDRDLVRDALLARGQLYARRGVPAKARADFVTVLTDYSPGNMEVLLQIGWLDLQLEHYNAALTSAGVVLAQIPGHPGAHSLRGKALQTMADLSMEQARNLLEASLSDAEAQRAVDLAWRAATLDFGHPYRNATLSELDDLFGDADMLQLQRFIDAATTCLTEARGSFVAALQTYADVNSMVELIAMLEKGDRWNDVVDFGVAATAHETVQQRLPAIQSLVAALDELHRPDFANAILSRASEEKLTMPPSLMATWCRLLYESEDWRRLKTVGRAAITEGEGKMTELRSTAVFFKGLANKNLKRWSSALNDLRMFTENPPRQEPIPDAMAIAYEGMAVAQHELGSRMEELKDLEHALNLAPDLGVEPWVRLSEVRLAQRESLPEASETLVPAIGLAAGQEQRELLERWQALSERAMNGRNQTLEGLRRAAEAKGTFVRGSEPKALTYEFYALGHIYQEEGKPYGMIEAGRAILDRYPDHVLGLDLLIEGQALLKSWTKVVELLIRRANLYGPYPGTRRLAAAIPEGLVTPEDYLRLMELDPKNTGLARVVVELRREGEDNLALEGLLAVTPKDRDAGLNLLAVEMCVDLENWRLAVETAGLVEPTSPEFSRALELALIAGADLGRPELLGRLVADFLTRAAKADLEPGAAERAALLMLAYDEVHAARVVLTTLDVPGKRTGTGLVALSLAHLAAGKTPNALEALERAEPFIEGPEAELARLILLCTTGSFAEVPAEVAFLRATTYVPAPWVDAALHGLSERMRECADSAGQALAAPGAEPEWQLVLAAANALLPEEDRVSPGAQAYAAEASAFAIDGGRDPRTVLAMLAALETPSGAAWVLRELSLSEATDLGPWPAWLRARAWDRLGVPARAHRIIDALVEEQPLFLPAWSRLEADLLRELGTPLSPWFPAFLERREDALGPDAAQPARELVVRAQRLARQRDLQGASQAFELERETLGKEPLAEVNEARLLRVMGRRGDAVPHFSAALHAIPPAEAVRLVDEFLALGTQAFQEGSLGEPAWRAELAALKARLPENPTASLAWARFERLTSTDKVHGWTLAREEYERFRAATLDRSLDELAPGSAADWAEFFLSENPREAEAMIRAELPRSPGSPGLWRLLAESLEGQGKADEAFERYAAATNILPDPRTLRLAAAILAQRGDDHDLLEQTIELIDRGERRGEPDSSLKLLRARSLSHGGLDGVRAALPLYEALWEDRASLRTPDEGYELALGYAVALLHRGDPADGPRVREILDQALPHVLDPYRRDLLKAYSHLARWMPEPRVEETGEAEDVEASAPAPGDEAQAEPEPREG